MTVVRKCDRQSCVSWWDHVTVMGTGKRGWGGVTVNQNCDINQESVKDTRKVCQLMERCDGYE